jgi:hypothetical protein
MERDGLCRSNPTLQDGKVDMVIAGMYITDQRKELVDLSTGYVERAGSCHPGRSRGYFQRNNWLENRLRKLVPPGAFCARADRPGHRTDHPGIC